MDSLEYDVRCDQCGARAMAWMRGSGVSGSYWEALVRMVAQRVVCA